LRPDPLVPEDRFLLLDPLGLYLLDLPLDQLRQLDRLYLFLQWFPWYLFLPWFPWYLFLPWFPWYRLFLWFLWFPWYRLFP
jgi:hypothetical protein